MNPFDELAFKESLVDCGTWPNHCRAHQTVTIVKDMKDWIGLGLDSTTKVAKGIRTSSPSSEGQLNRAKRHLRHTN